MEDRQLDQAEFQGKVLEKLENIEITMEKKLDRIEFEPIKAIVYGMVGLIMMTVVGAILTTVVKAVETVIK